MKKYSKKAQGLIILVLCCLYAFLCTKAFYKRDVVVNSLTAEISAAIITFLVLIAISIRQKRLIFLEKKGKFRHLKATVFIIFMPIFTLPVIFGVKSILIEYFGRYQEATVVEVIKKERADSYKTGSSFYIYLEPSVTKNPLRISKNLYDKLQEKSKLKVRTKASNLGFYLDEKDIVIIK